ncbi:MAG: 2-amino-4-hydroxy-6-hydroxymethyldihydropteridine diphosphokinase [Candidatus Goldiibacteriota bacterium]
MNKVYLGLGTNLGNKKENLKKCMDMLPESGVPVLKRSYVYRTQPVGDRQQPFFLNMCVLGETHLKPGELLRALKKTEEIMGRKKGPKWGPRIIDIDILFYNNIIFNSSGLVVPHPEIVRRRFVLEPLCDIASDYVHPQAGKTIKTLLEEGVFDETSERTGEIND